MRTTLRNYMFSILFLTQLLVALVPAHPIEEVIALQPDSLVYRETENLREAELQASNQLEKLTDAIDEAETDEGLYHKPCSCQKVRRSVVTGRFTHWPNGIVPYDISTSFSPSDREKILQAIDIFNNATCVRFIPHTVQGAVVHFLNDNTGCWSSIGKQGIRQDINLQVPECLKQPGNILHEMMHTIGFRHEHTRTDRDDYISINYTNITPLLSMQRNFVLDEPKGTSNQNISYDYGSVMHYSEFAFTVNNETTLYPKQETKEHLGQRIGFSPLDIEKIKRAYNCT